MIKIQIGGSPCTRWSIAQKKDRETAAEGVGWELFKNYLIAKEKFRPDIFLYENNKSAAQAIKDQISEELGEPLQYINSALVSAQNRQRFYCHNFGDVPQPEDRGILLRDILESGIVDREKAYCLLGQYGGRHSGPRNYFKKAHGQVVFEPVRIGTIENTAKNQHFDSKPYRVYSADGKAVTLQGEAGGAGAKTGLYACPIEAQGAAWRGRAESSAFEVRKDGKGNALAAEGHQSRYVAQKANGKETPVYEVSGGMVDIKGKRYEINLPDGLYIIRKLTVKEAARLQTLPDDYCRAVSDNQAYRGLGNGWTAEVIIHLLGHALASVPKNEEIVVLSMYDGIGTGRYCFDKLGYHNIKYYAYEIDPYPIKIAMSNYPDIIQCGDAFRVRASDWEIPITGSSAAVNY